MRVLGRSQNYQELGQIFELCSGGIICLQPGSCFNKCQKAHLIQLHTLSWTPGRSSSVFILVSRSSSAHVSQLCSFDTLNLAVEAQPPTLCISSSVSGRSFVSFRPRGVAILDRRLYVSDMSEVNWLLSQTYWKNDC